MLVVLGGCGQPAVPVAPPTGPGEAACRQLHHRLPDEVADRGRRDTQPTSARTAAWGDPAVVLRCGTRRPDGLTATAALVVVNGVEWFVAERPDAFVFTTYGRKAYVQVSVPRSVGRTGATAPLVGLAEPIRAAVPRA